MYLEEQGIFVFQFPMPVEENRGFSLVRKEHPLVIVINSQDSPNGRIFTLFHEYCHTLNRSRENCAFLVNNQMPGAQKSFIEHFDVLWNLKARDFSI